MSKNFMVLISLWVLVIVDTAFGQTWQSSVRMPTDPKPVQLYNVVLNGFKNHIAEKIYEGKTVDPNIFPQSYDIREANSSDGPSRCKKPDSEKPYIATLSWRWLRSSLHKIDLYVCVSNDLASPDTVEVIPGTHRAMNIETEKFIVINPTNGGHLYREVGDDENIDQLPLKACLPEGFVVHGFTNGVEVNSNPKGVSILQRDTVKAAEPNCVVVYVHVQGHGHDTILGVRASKGGGSIGVDLSLWGSTVDNDTAERIYLAKP